MKVLILVIQTWRHALAESE